MLFLFFSIIDLILVLQEFINNSSFTPIDEKKLNKYFLVDQIEKNEFIQK